MTKKLFIVFVIAVVLVMLVAPSLAVKPTPTPNPHDGIWNAIEALQLADTTTQARLDALEARIVVLERILSCGDGTCSGTENNQNCPADCPAACSETNDGKEACDALDNDCNGVVDDGFNVGSSCGGVGVCSAGILVCSGDGLGTECNGATLPSAEICDQLDNDCDGMVDEQDVGICDENQACVAGECRDISCEDGICSGTENLETCEADCSICGDDVCTGPETPMSCAADCP